MIASLHLLPHSHHRPWHLHLPEWIHRGAGWWGALFGLYPRIGEGEVDTHSWFFRARGNRWEVTISSTPQAIAEDEYLDDVAGAFAIHGSYSREEGSAGDMPDDDVVALLEHSFMAWRTSYANEIGEWTERWEGEGGAPAWSE
jgi:hypothetical protein